MGKVQWGSSFVPWGSMLGAMLVSMLVSSFQGMGEVTMGKIPVGFQADSVGSKSSSRCVFGARRPRPELALLRRSPRAVASPVGSTTLTGFQVRFDIDPTGDATARGFWPNRGSSGRGLRAPKPRGHLQGSKLGSMAPGGPARSFASPVGSTWNLTWTR